MMGTQIKALPESWELNELFYTVVRERERDYSHKTRSKPPCLSKVRM